MDENMNDWITLEAGEYSATSDDGGIQVDRESALGIATVRLRADYAANALLLAACRRALALPALISEAQAVVSRCDALRTDTGYEKADELHADAEQILAEIRAAISAATGKTQEASSAGGTANHDPPGMRLRPGYRWTAGHGGRRPRL